MQSSPKPMPPEDLSLRTIGFAGPRKPCGWVTPVVPEPDSLSSWNKFNAEEMPLLHSQAATPNSGVKWHMPGRITMLIKLELSNDRSVFLSIYVSLFVYLYACVSTVLILFLCGLSETARVHIHINQLFIMIIPIVSMQQIDPNSGSLFVSVSVTSLSHARHCRLIDGCRWLLHPVRSPTTVQKR